MEADKFPTVLVIDDEPANLGVLFEHLGHAGLKTLVAQSGHFALQILERCQPDIVLLDIMLPDTDGFDLCRQIRERNKDRDIPVIFLSALSDTETKIRALELDAVDYITKPFQPQEIIARIKRHLLIRDLQWQLQEQNVLLQQEISEHRATEEALRRAKEDWERTFDALQDLIAILDNDYRIVRANKAMAAKLGMTPEECAGLTCYHAVHGTSEPPSFCPHRQLLADGIAHTTEVHEYRLGGDFVVSVSPLFDPSGKLIGSVHAARDITEHKRLEAQRMEMERRIRESQKVESLGRMAGGIAHHFNNLLAAVMGNLELAMDDLPADALAGDCLSEAMRASRRAADLSRLMLSYVGQGVLEKTLCDLSEEVLRTVPLIEATLPGKVLLEKSVGSCLPLVNVDADSLRQIFVNLASNAWESLSDAGGIVRITTGAEFVEEATMSKVVGTEAPLPGNFVFIEVSDEGCGMNAETMARMFDPFFSTKLMGRGLGLATVAGILRSHQGAMLVDSRPGMGTNVRILLPVAGEPRCSVTAEPDLVARGSQFSRSCSLGALTVLLAEDEEMVRRMGQVMLERLGYTVITANDGAEAVELFRQYKDRIACVLLDLTMPRLNGWEALQFIREIRADVPVILASGYDEAHVMQQDHAERPQAFLQKPFQMAALKAALGTAGIAPP